MKALQYDLGIVTGPTPALKIEDAQHYMQHVWINPIPGCFGYTHAITVLSKVTGDISICMYITPRSIADFKFLD